jgi:DNA adenine methylase
MHDDLPEEQLPEPRPVVSWAGGKQRLLKYLLPLVPEHTRYVEPFGGGLAMLLAKPRSALEVVNDINGDLVKFYWSCKYHLEPLQDELDLVLNSRRVFEAYCSQPGLTEIQRAARWFLRNKLSFGGNGEDFAISKTQPLTSRSARLVLIHALNRRLDRTTIENKSWEYIFRTYDTPETFFFLDPPYPEPGFTYEGWDELALERFCAAVRLLQGRWIFTFKANAQVRDLMAGYSCQTIERSRPIGSNTRAGRKSGSTERRVYREIIITSTPAIWRERRKGKSA